MTDHLTASKRMTELLSQYTNALAIRNIAAWGEYDVEKARAQLLTAIAEIEQRAEKWKEVALAKSLLEIAKCTSNLDDFSTLLKHAVEREKAAIAALGDEWDEAVKEKYHG